ncbi:MAG: tRNA (uridine(34)/cytosine(34)/5-carboxymethylaminomethyluridine(34)-2'-O)-methyltransferase TrmL [Gammaproteobacteria bacterium]|nr:tRNA (uridine(34)/cytosine(34)/5-carboxymethylaminomethyluridine(34)-2'-O)-methyltransferase TrmL [Gammaproteobacteria bacterium]
MQIVLFEPEIPPNTGNIIRLCANTGAILHLIHPLGFAPNDKQLKRAGLDYHEWARVHHHQSYEHFINDVKPSRVFACSTHGTHQYVDVEYQANDVLLFGPETRGLPKKLLNQLPERQVIRIPMLKDSRSLNLSNAVAIIAYEALRQIGFSMLSLK